MALKIGRNCPDYDFFLSHKAVSQVHKNWKVQIQDLPYPTPSEIRPLLRNSKRDAE